MTSMTDIDEIAEIFKILSVGTRIRILILLRERPLCVGALSGKLGITPSAVSQHLRILRNARLVTATRRGNFIHYQLNTDVLKEFTKTINSFCCKCKSFNQKHAGRETSCPAEGGDCFPRQKQ